MIKRKSPITAIGLATGAVALESAWPSLNKFIISINFSLLHLPALSAIWPNIQKILENGYYYLTVVNVWNYLVILVAVILEGPIATLLGGMWASMGRVNLWAILLVSMVAGIVADSFWYYLGYFGREQMVERWGKHVKVDLATIDKIEQVLFGDNANRVIFTTKLTSALIIPTLITAGMSQLGWRRVMRTMVAAQFLWSAGLTALGFLAADSFVLMSRQVEHFGLIAGIAIGLLFVGRIVYRWRKSAVEVGMQIKD